MNKQLVAILAVLLFPTTILAEDNLYLNIGMSHLNTDVENTGLLLEPEFGHNTLDLGIGTELNNVLSSELRLGKSFSDNTYNGSDVDIDYYYGLYLKGKFNNNSSFTPYLLAGYTNTKYEGVDDLGFATDSSFSDFSYGAGFNLNVSDSFSLNLEYKQLNDKDDFKLDGYSVGFEFEL